MDIRVPTNPFPKNKKQFITLVQPPTVLLEIPVFGAVVHFLPMMLPPYTTRKMDVPMLSPCPLMVR